MIKFRSIFTKLLTTYVIIVLISLSLLGLLSAKMYEWNSIQEKLRDMGKSIDSTQETFIDGLYGRLTDEQVISAIKQSVLQEDTGIVVLNKIGGVWLSITNNEQIRDLGEEFTQHIVNMRDEVFSGETTSYLIEKGGLFSAPYAIVGKPLWFEGVIVGAIFECAEITELSSNFQLLYPPILIAGGITLLVAFVTIYFISKNITQPLRSLTLAAKELSKGNFQKRVEITEKDEIGQLGEAFNTMGEELERYENTRTSFVANVSHELKSPLTSMQGFVQGILDGTIPKEDEDQYLEIVLSETKRLNLLIRDLLDLAKIESGQFPLNIREFDINELVRKVIITFETKIDAKQIEVSVNLPDEKTIVQADEDRITQVLMNLIDNAVKFVNTGGVLRIWTNRVQNRVQINIGNSGDVIPPEVLSQVFDRFYKADQSHNRNTPGTGIGLSIVKSIILQHGQEIYATSTKEQGTVFTFTLQGV